MHLRLVFVMAGVNLYIGGKNNVYYLSKYGIM